MMKIGFDSARSCRPFHELYRRSIGYSLLLLSTWSFTVNPCRADKPVMNGDFELMRLIRAAHKDNRMRIQTWQGAAIIEERMHHQADPNPTDEGGVSAGEVSFAMDRSRNALRWNRTDTKHRFLKGDVSGTLPLGFNNGIFKSDGLYRYRKVGSLNTETQLLIFPATDRETNRDALDFDPEYYLISPDLPDPSIEDTLTHYFDASKKARNEVLPSGHSVTIAIERQKDLINIAYVIRRPEGQINTEWQFDMSKGGNLLVYRQDAPEGHVEVLCSYRQNEGIWIPQSIEHHSGEKKTDTRPGTALYISVKFNKAIINRSIDESEFAVDKLGVKMGDRVVDRRHPGAPFVYKYTGASPQAASGDPKVLLTGRVTSQPTNRE